MKLQSYQLAYAYKKTKIWEKFTDMDLFAVKVPDGRIIYLCIMGKEHGYCALAVYTDMDSFQSYYQIIDSYNVSSSITSNELMLTQDCLQCAFESSRELEPQALDELKKAVKQMNMTLRGKNACAHFIKFEPFKVSYPIQLEDDEYLIDEALKACIDLADLMQNGNPSDLGILPYDESHGRLILLDQKDGTYGLDGTCKLPPIVHMAYHAGPCADEDKVRQILSIRKSGTLECRFIHILAPVTDEFPPYLPCGILAVETTEGKVIPMMAEKTDDEHALINDFADALIQAHLHPFDIHVEDDRTQQMLSAFCTQTKINLVRVGELEQLSFAYHALHQFLRP